MSVKSIDWGSLLAKLEALAQQIPTIANDVKQTIEDILAGLLTKQATAPAKCDHGCKERVLGVLRQQRCELVEALRGNFCVHEYIECCCPDEEEAV